MNKSFRILGEPGNLLGLSIGQSGRKGFRWNQTLTFEAGLLTPYPTGFEILGGGDQSTLAVNAAAAMRGNFGFFCGIPDASTRFGRLTTPNNEKIFFLEFLFDPNTLTMANGDAFFLINNVSSGPGGAAFQVQLVMTGVNYELAVLALLDVGNVSIPNFVIQDIAQMVGIKWKASTNPGDDNGSIEAFINGVSVGSQVDLDNDQHDVDDIRLGANGGLDAGTGGAGEGIFFDNIQWANKFR